MLDAIYYIGTSSYKSAILLSRVTSTNIISSFNKNKKRKKKYRNHTNVVFLHELAGAAI